ncbi:MAG: hypothetical protein ACRDJH_04175 [Thermomicrobiales bacterium]
MTLSLLVFTLGVRPWLAIVLTAATYAGVVLVRPRTERLQGETVDDASREQLAYQTALANAAAIRALAPRIAKPAVREQVGRISDQIDRVLAAMREDSTLAAASLFNERLLETLKSILSDYVLLTTRGIKSADAVLAKTEMRDLPTIEQAVIAFYEKLHRALVVNLAALGDVLEFNLEGIAVPTAWRDTP